MSNKIQHRARQFVRLAHREAKRLRDLGASEAAVHHSCYRVAESPSPLWGEVRSQLRSEGIDPDQYQPQ